MAQEKGQPQTDPNKKIISSGHFGEEFLVIIYDILTTNYRREIHFNAKLGTPWSEVLKNLSITLSFEQDGYPAGPGACTEQHLKTIKVVQLCHFA